VKECVELGMFGCVVVQKLLQGEDVDFRSMKKVIMHKHHNMFIQKCKDKALIPEVTEKSSWHRIWKRVLEHGGIVDCWVASLH